jgi:hypothetical protein
MSAFAIFRRWPIASWLFVVHATFVLLIYIQWAADSSIERGMIWMTVFLIDRPSSYLIYLSTVKIRCGSMPSAPSSSAGCTNFVSG